MTLPLIRNNFFVLIIMTLLLVHNHFFVLIIMTLPLVRYFFLILIIMGFSFQQNLFFVSLVVGIPFILTFMFYIIFIIKLFTFGASFASEMNLQPLKLFRTSFTNNTFRFTHACFLRSNINGVINCLSIFYIFK